MKQVCADPAIVGGLLLAAFIVWRYIKINDKDDEQIKNNQQTADNLNVHPGTGPITKTKPVVLLKKNR